jgi:hypothetical protein
MNGSAIDSILPVFGIPVAALGTVIPCGKLQTLVPTVSEEGIPNLRALVLSYIPLLHISASPLRTYASGSIPFLADAAIY